MAQDRPWAAGEDRSDYAAASRRRCVAPAVYPVMQRLQPPALDPPPDSAATEPERRQLLPRHDATLPLGDRGDQPIAVHS